MQRLRDAAGKPAVNDEPNRTNHAGQNFGVALITKLYGLGDTAHLDHLRWAQLPTGEERRALEARRRGWSLIPTGFRGRYTSAGEPGDPVISIDSARVLRSVSSTDGTRGYVVMIGVKPGGEETVQWGKDWRHEEIGREQGVVLYRVMR
jgi:hypothetical protein